LFYNETESFSYQVFVGTGIMCVKGFRVFIYKNKAQQTEKQCNREVQKLAIMDSKGISLLYMFRCPYPPSKCLNVGPKTKPM